jgi:hypothetical protein
VSILVNTGPTTLTKTWYVDGTATDVGTVTIGIDDGDGNEIVAAGASVTDGSDGTYEYDVAVQTAPKQLVVTWTSGDQNQVDYLEIVGGWLFTEPELRAFYSSDLTSESTYPDAKIAEARDRITAAFEKHCGVSFVRRWRRETHSGDGSAILTVDRPYVSSVSVATVGGTDVSASVTNAPVLPYLYRTSATWTHATQASPFNVVVSYVHGHQSVPGDIKRAAMIAARHELVKDTGAGVPETASSWNDATGQYVSFSPNDQTERWYGIPKVDSALREFNMKIPVS